MKTVIFFFGAIVTVLLVSGCISGNLTDTINPDGSIHRFLEIDKTGILATANCKSVKSWAQMNQNISVARLDALERSCRETQSSIIIEFNLPYGDDANPVKIMESDDGQHIRYEGDIISYIITRVKMPSKIISHNGELLDEYTVAFKGNDTSPYMGYAECKRPELGTSSFITSIIIAGCIVILVSVGIGFFFLHKRRNKL